jgi:hypothetical protein
VDGPDRQLADRPHDARRLVRRDAKAAQCSPVWSGQPLRGLCSSRRLGMLCLSMTLEDIQQAVPKLSPEDRAKLRRWLVEFEAVQAGDRDRNTTASKLGRLAGRAVADFGKRMREP